MNYMEVTKKKKCNSFTVTSIESGATCIAILNGTFKNINLYNRHRFWTCNEHFIDNLAANWCIYAFE